MKYRDYMAVICIDIAVHGQRHKYIDMHLLSAEMHTIDNKHSVNNSLCE